LPVTRDGVLVTGKRIEDDLDFDDDERPRARQRRGMTAGVGAIVLLALAGWAAGFLLTGTSPTAGPSPRVGGGASPQIVVPAPVPIPELEAVVEGDGIRFSWIYEDELPGDFFRVWPLEADNGEFVDVFEPTYLVEDEEDACIDVAVVRGNGLMSNPPARLCYPE
jgi:hypothetical protein